MEFNIAMLAKMRGFIDEHRELHGHSLHWTISTWPLMEKGAKGYGLYCPTCGKLQVVRIDRDSGEGSADE